MVSKKDLISVIGASLICLVLTAFLPTQAQASHRIEINELIMPQAPDWLTQSRVQKVVDGISSKLDWDIRKIHVDWYTDQAAFEKLHGFGSTVLAFSMKKTMSISIGPKVTTENFDSVFGHELVHIILYQKFKDSIPSWLDEGLANYLSRHGTVDYAWLAKQPHPDVRTMTHPFKSAVQSPQYQYMASTALIEMIAAKCGLDDMLQLSVGSKFEAYLSTFCEIPDINAAFIQWLNSKASKHSKPAHT